MYTFIHLCTVYILLHLWPGEIRISAMVYHSIPIAVIVQLLSHLWLFAARPPCPSLSPGVCPSSRPLNWWCCPTISSSAALFFCLQSFLASRSYPVSWLFASGGQSFRWYFLYLYLYFCVLYSLYSQQLTQLSTSKKCF